MFLCRKLRHLAWFLLMVSACGTGASQYSPPGLYDVEHVRLENGMNVILKPRHNAHKLSLRVRVGVGSQDYECGSQETPHFLEHLMFTGTSKYSEAELDHRVTDRGGVWNAYTGSENTVYEMDIYSRYGEFAVRTLYEILTDSIFSPENVELSREIIHREAGGKPSAIRQWLRLRGIGVNGTEKAVMKLLPGSDYICPGYETAEGITREDILQAYRRFYVPSNMALIVVGDFSREAMLQYIRSTFGMIPASAAPERRLKRPGEVMDYSPSTGTFAPLISSDAVVGFLYRLPDHLSDDHYAIALIAEHLAFRVNEILRIERGLSYSPGTWSDALSTFGLFSVSADVDIDKTDEVIDILREELRALVDEPLTHAELERVKMKILLLNVQGYESTASFADFYVGEYDKYRVRGEYVDDEARFEAVTTQDIARVARRYFSLDRAIVVRETPTLTVTQLYLLIGALLVLFAGGLLYFYLRVRSGDGS